MTYYDERVLPTSIEDLGGDRSLTGRWIVDVKGGPWEEGFEISVLREDNEHGIRSYGWFDRNKLLISHNGGPCRWPLTKDVWDKMLKLAQEVANDLNGIR